MEEGLLWNDKGKGNYKYIRDFFFLYIERVQQFCFYYSRIIRKIDGIMQVT